MMIGQALEASSITSARPHPEAIQTDAVSTCPSWRTRHILRLSSTCHGESEPDALKGDKTGKTVVPVLLHGDAAFAGQGVVYESMQMKTR